MNKRMLVVLGASFALTCILAALCIFHPVIDRDLNLSKAQHQRGFLYTINLDDVRPPLMYRFNHDSMNGDLSTLQLLENGQPIGVPHSPHDSIARDGRGRYSHWYSDLYFSSPDNTDPQLGSKRFSIRDELSPGFILVLAAILSGAATLVFLAAFFGTVGSRVNMKRFSYSTAPLEQHSLSPHPHRIDDTIPVKMVGAVLFCTFFVLAFRLRQRDLEFLIQPDFHWQRIETWRAFLSTLDTNLLPVPRPDVYMDGQFIVYSIAEVGLRGLANQIKFLRQFFPNDLSFAFGAALLTNIVAYAAACVIFFAGCYHLTGRLLIAALAAIGLFFTPQMLDINIGRMDYLISLPLMTIFYCSCILALAQERRRHALALGAALAFAATIKINGLFFGVLPAFAAIASFRFERTAVTRLASFVAHSVTAFVIVFALLMARYVYYLSPAEILQYYRASIALQMRWASVFVGPPFYYNLDIMRGSGWPFIALYLACAVAVLVVAAWRRSRPAVFLSLCFVGLSVAGALTQKYIRGGYHLLPVFFALIALTATAILDAAGNRIARYCLVTIGGLAFAATLVTSITKYQVVVAERKAEPIGLQDLKRVPRTWLRTHVAAGTTICIQSDSGWTLPPLDGFKVVNGPLTLPYLDREALAHSDPPSVAGLENTCRVIITSDFHRTLFDEELEKVSPATETKWASFFQALDRRYPPKIFSSPVAIYAKEVYVNDLRGR